MKNLLVLPLLSSMALLAAPPAPKASKAPSAPSAPRGASAFREGLWEMSMTTHMEGLPIPVPARTVVIRHCLTRENLVPREATKAKCTYTVPRISGNKVNCTFDCTDSGMRVSGTTEMTYTGDTCEGTTITNMSGQGMTMKATIAIKGKYLGPCGAGDGSPVIVEDAATRQAREMVQAGQAAQATREKETADLASMKIPALKPGAPVYLKADGTLNAAGASQGGALPLREGEWEILEETATMLPGQALGASKANPYRACLSPATPIPSGLLGRVSGEGEEVRRSGNVLGWTPSVQRGVASMEGTGGLEFHGDTFTGGLVHHTKLLGMTTTFYTRITGRRIGDKVCQEGRGFSGRAYTARAGRDYTAKAKAAIPDPKDKKDDVEELKKKAMEGLKTLKGLFGR